MTDNAFNHFFQKTDLSEVIEKLQKGKPQDKLSLLQSGFFQQQRKEEKERSLSGAVRSIAIFKQTR